MEYMRRKTYLRKRLYVVHDGKLGRNNAPVQYDDHLKASRLTQLKELHECDKRQKCETPTQPKKGRV